MVMAIVALAMRIEARGAIGGSLAHDANCLAWTRSSRWREAEI
jgi:hypothetical protein